MIDKKYRHKNPVSIERLNELFECDSRNGVLRRKRHAGNRAAGSVVGTPSRHKDTAYLTVEISNKQYSVHRIIWAMHYNEWPARDIDHINGDGLDNRIDNLRDASVSQNLRNSKNYRRKHNLPRGVNKNNGKFVARIRVNGELIHLGTHETVEQAKSAYDIAAKKYFGEWARCQ